MLAFRNKADTRWALTANHHQDGVVIAAEEGAATLSSDQQWELVRYMFTEAEIIERLNADSLRSANPSEYRRRTVRK